MPKKFQPEKRDNGSYISAGLNDKQFNQLFNKIQKANAKNRRNAKRTLKRSTFTNPTNKALAALGKKANGTGFTKDDLVKFDKARQRHKEKYNSKTDGITYAFLVKNSRDIDIKRANNQVDDGTGITSASFYGIKGNLALINVKASIGSKHQNHRVKVRLEQWDELIDETPDNDYQKATKLACAGRISIDCDCGRHQYWYRYLATMGKYAVAPPNEFAFPKIKNPELSGVACKHVLKAATMLQSPAWQRILANQMKAQAKRTGYGQTKTYFLNEEEKQQAAKNRKTKTDKGAADREFAKYQRSQKAMERALANQRKNGTTVKRQARKIRRQEKKLSEYEQMIKVGFQNFHDGYKLQGRTKKEAVSDFAKMMNVSPSKIERLAK
ncbi:phage tail protein [Vibrio harveyi]|uniref:Phage tail protein n=1 Tax=Vibrio harveyi TaxID=669 RepID=A0A8B3DRE5_VIBHA|nr:phage tail protein [Vibrio harveyi]RIW17904.1 phage tail protein [Vibrio harveyi]